MSFEKSVFINCPFDAEYTPLLRALIFVNLYLGFEPKISTNTSSGKQRIDEIMHLMKTSKYSIHDISRCEPLRPGDLPRFNMPYEMGLDIGCSKFGNKTQQGKVCLILEKDKNRYDQVISDISGQDIKDHENVPEVLIKKVREWYDSILEEQLPSNSKLWSKYIECNARINVVLTKEGHTQEEINLLSHVEYIKAARKAIISIKL